MMMLVGLKLLINIIMDVRQKIVQKKNQLVDQILARNDIQRAGVQYILDTVIPRLVEDPTRRFVYVEMAYLWRWWIHQSDEMKNTVRTLVNQSKSM